ncbi:hypothetical protein LXA43DRAFT_752479 [Ganoderma leucocontextum]|nr:hypothetical protein LXA43DRAFT_752479 [Ganoderma leucocontextum]
MLARVHGQHQKMAGLFFRQFWALFWKNWVVMSKHPWLNILRCFIMPIAYGVFLAVAQIFLSKPNNYGLGTSAPASLTSSTVRLPSFGPTGRTAPGPIPPHATSYPTSRVICRTARSATGRIEYLPLNTCRLIRRASSLPTFPFESQAWIACLSHITNPGLEYCAENVPIGEERKALVLVQSDLPHQSTRYCHP